MAKDLRTFLRRLEERAPDELLRVRRPVSVDLELTGVLRKLQSEQRYPAVIFERIQDKKLRVVSNLLGNTRLLAEALETTPEELTRTYIEREDARMAVKEVSDAPVQEVVITGADVDLHEMPIVVNCGKDSGQFISAGVTTVRVPEAGNHNSGIYRAQIHSRNRLGMSYEKHTHIGTVHRAAEARGEPVDCAIWVGHHPATLLGCQSKIPYGEDEYEVMGGLLHAYVQIRKEYDGAGKIAALAALASDPFVKLAVVVDEDVDIHDDAEVLWAIATRTQPDRDTFFVPESATSRLDPASYSIWSRWEKDTMNTKWAIDATKPVEAPFEERADVPREVWEPMDRSEYIEGWR